MARVGLPEAGIPHMGGTGCGHRPHTDLQSVHEGAVGGEGGLGSPVGLSWLTSLLSRSSAVSAPATTAAVATLDEHRCPACGAAAAAKAALMRRISPRVALGLAQGLASDPGPLERILSAFDRRSTGGAAFTDLRERPVRLPPARRPEDWGASEGESEGEGEEENGGEGKTDGAGGETTGLGEREGGPRQNEGAVGRRKSLEDGRRPSRRGSLQSPLLGSSLDRFSEVLQEALSRQHSKDCAGVVCQAFTHDGASPRLHDIWTCPHCGVAELEIYTENGGTIQSVSPSPNDRELIRAKRLSSWRPSSNKGCRRALLIAIDYWGCKKDQLGGCIEDCTTMLRLLVEDFHFPETQIVVLNDYNDHWGQDKFPNVHRHEAPTRENIMYWLHWLTRGAREGDSLFLYFAGHGTQEEDRTLVEINGTREVLWPVDHRERRVSVITDDEVYDEVVEKVPRGSRLFAIFDCCHHGTNMDLPYLSCGSESNEWTVTGSKFRKLQELKQPEAYQWSSKPFEPPPADESLGEVISLAATNESGKSIERPLQATSPCASPRAPGKTKPEFRHKGVMTECFKRTIARNRATLDTMTFDRLIKELAEELHAVAFSGDIPSSDELQAPQLASNHLFDRKSLFII